MSATSTFGATAVVPSAYTDVPGDANLVVFGLGDSALNQMRHMQVFDAGEFSGPIVLSGMSFRVEEGFGTGGKSFTDVTLPNMVVNLSTTESQVDALSSTFADNYGDDATNVVNGDLTLSGTHDNTLSPFDVYVPFSRPFLYDPSKGNLLLEVVNPNGSIATSPLDAAFTTGDSMSGMFAPTVDATSATFNDSRGLITQFKFVPFGPETDVPAPQSYAQVFFTSFPDPDRDITYPYIVDERNDLSTDNHFRREWARAAVNPFGGSGPDNPFGGGQIGVDARVDVFNQDPNATTPGSKSHAIFQSVFTPLASDAHTPVVDIDLNFVLDGYLEAFRTMADDPGYLNSSITAIARVATARTLGFIDLVELEVSWDGEQFIFESDGNLLDGLLQETGYTDSENNPNGGRLTFDISVADLPEDHPLRQRFEDVAYVAPGDWVAIQFEMIADANAQVRGTAAANFFNTLSASPTSDTPGITFDPIPEPASAVLFGLGAVMSLRRQPTMRA